MNSAETSRRQGEIKAIDDTLSLEDLLYNQLWYGEAGDAIKSRLYGAAVHKHDPGNPDAIRQESELFEMISKQRTQISLGPIDARCQGMPYTRKQFSFGVGAFNEIDGLGYIGNHETKESQIAIGFSSDNETCILENEGGKKVSNQKGLGLLLGANRANYVYNGNQNSIGLIFLGTNSALDFLDGVQKSFGLIRARNMANIEPGFKAHQRSIGFYASNELHGGNKSNETSQTCITLIGGNITDVITGIQFLISTGLGLNYTKLNYGTQITISLKGTLVVGTNFGTMICAFAITSNSNRGKIFCLLKIGSKKRGKKSSINSFIRKNMIKTENCFLSKKEREEKLLL